MTTTFSLVPDQARLRSCQKLAYKALLKHFRTKGAARNAIVELPTGTGKTALLALAPFGLSKTRTLILTPSVKLAKDIAASLDVVEHPHDNIFVKLGLFTDKSLASNDLFVLRLEGSVNRGDIEEHHIIVANYHQLQDVEKWFAGNQDLIDLIIIDEAHHQAAGTYQEILKFFPSARVIGLTATPFRSDGKKIDGTPVYKYHFHEAIKDKVIRNIRVSNVSPEQIQLTFLDESTKRYTLKEVLDLKEEAWFNRGIALSQDCCDSIARKAKEKLDELRRDHSDDRHQIIAGAMSKRHAREIVKPAFEKLGLSVGMVSSDESDREHNAETFDKLKRGKLDVIVHIGMLGEGFDHPPLGVAAIFRPFKSLNPYIQFIGRVIRRNGSTPYSYVVSHLGLNQLQRFQEFRMFDNDDQGFIATLFDTAADQAFVPDDGNQKGGRNNGSADGPVITELGIETVEIGDEFLDEAARLDTIESQVRSLSEKNQTELLQRLGLKLTPGTSIASTTTSKRVKPVDKRKASRSLLNEKAKSIAVDVLKDLGLKLHGRDFNPMFINLAWVIKRVSKDINKAVGIGQGKRKEITNPQYDALESGKVLSRIKRENLDYFRQKSQ
jgi:DNA repair protein RadD